MPPGVGTSALAGLLRGLNEGRDRRDAREEQARQIARQEAQDKDARELGTLQRMTAQFQLDAPKRQAEREGVLASLTERLAGGDESAYGELAAMDRQNPLVVERTRQAVANAQPETFGDFEDATDETGKAIRVQRGNRGTIRRTGLAPYQAPKQAEPTRGIEVTTDKGVSLVNPVTGDEIRRLGNRPPSQAATSGPKPPKAPTGEQSKARIFHGLMSKAAPIMDALSEDPEVRPAAIAAALAGPELLDGVLGPVLNKQLNAKEQQLIRASRDYAAGVKRSESGAAVSKPEVRETINRYVSMFGDAPETRSAKKQARDEYIALMAEEALPAQLYSEAVKNNGLPRITQAEEAAGETGEFAPKSGKPSIGERIAQLKAEKVSKEQARAILQREGYKVP